MEDLKDVSVNKVTSSKYIALHRINYTQNGEKKIWDMIKKHESVSVLLHHVERESFIFVRQFRPAVYIEESMRRGQDLGQPINTEKTPASEGITLELCAGIVDKDCSLAEIAKQEVLEECGYDVPVEKFERIRSYRSAVGTAGSKHTIFFTQVNESMKISRGGGNEQEGELIDLVEVKVKDGYDFVMDDSIKTTSGLMFAVLWFFHNNCGGS